MIGATIRLLQTDTFNNVSEEVEIAKGKFELPTSVDDWKEKIIRVWKSRGLKLKNKTNG